jgi:hypothetical protein
MKQIGILTGLALALTLTGCKKESKDDAKPADTTLEQMQEVGGIRRTSEYTFSGKAEYQGHTYEYTIHRQPDTELPTVLDEDGNKYYDNSISVAVKRDGSDFYSHTFRKESFRSHLDDDFLTRGILEGLVFDKVEADGLHFASSVSYPMSDMYIPMIVILGADASITIKKDVNMDADIPNPQPDVDDDEDGV